MALHILGLTQIRIVIATARHEAGSNLNFYMKKQIVSVVPHMQ
ncbi:MAG: hypothetical protein V1781_02920 [Bacteroidota bacterium]